MAIAAKPIVAVALGLGTLVTGSYIFSSSPQNKPLFLNKEQYLRLVSSNNSSKIVSHFLTKEDEKNVCGIQLQWREQGDLKKILIDCEAFYWYKSYKNDQSNGIYLRINKKENESVKKVLENWKLSNNENSQDKHDWQVKKDNKTYNCQKGPVIIFGFGEKVGVECKEINSEVKKD